MVSDRKFEELVRTHQQAVFAYARSMTRSSHAAEEIVQETFVRAWKYLDSFRGDGSMEGWLIRICRHSALDLAAKDRSSAPMPDIVRIDQPDSQADLWALLDELPLADREVLVVCGALGYDYESASEILDIPVGTVRSRLSRSRTRLAELLDVSEAG